MAISFTRPDPSSPSSVASASFTTARKGFEPAEVREFLRMVAAELARLQERERFLERELRTAQRSTSPMSVALDEELVTKMLGEEAARILHTARDASSQIKNRAEESSARLLREANDEAQRVREEAEIEAARRRSDATADAESELEMAKQQGRDMVNEARAYRERVLNELARRRELARQQIEQLVHGRDRLLQAFERSRLVAVDVMAELTPLGEPSEYVNLSPTTGPVPLMVPNMLRPSERANALETPAADVDATVALAVPPADSEPGDVVGATMGISTDIGTDASVTIFVDEDFESDRHGLDATESNAIIDEIDIDIDIEVQAEITGDTSEQSGEGDGSDERVVRLDIGPHDPATTDDGGDRDPAPVVSLFAGEVDRRNGHRADSDVGVDEYGEVVEFVDFGSRDDTTTAADTTAGADAPRAAGAPAPTDAPDLSELPSDADPTTVLARTSADDLFARLRAARADSVAQRAVASSRETEFTKVSGATAHDHPSTQPHAVPVERPNSTSSEVTIGDDSVFATTPAAPQDVVTLADSPFARRDEALTPLITAAARKLKRVLADEQNEVLHALRRKEPVRDLGSMLATERDQAERYSSSIAVELVAAATAGAVSMGMDTSAARREAKKAPVTAPATEVLMNDVVAPLRERLARCVSDADGDNAELASLVRLAYREWKNQRIDEHLDDVTRAAFGRGALVGVAPGTRICWLVDPAGPACADAEDNALAGAIGAGEAFPTDHRCAPAHSGCRCMIAPAD